MLRNILILLTASIIFQSLPAAALEETETLRGIQAVNVIVEQLPDFIDRSGKNKFRVQREVEAYLRKTGLNVLSGDQALEQDLTTGMPYIYVQPTVVPARKDEMYAFHILVELRQRVKPVRDPSMTIFSPTWRYAVTGTEKNYRLQELLRDVEEALDKFDTDYRTVNGGK